MKKNWKMIGIAVLAAGLISYPALKLYQYLTRKKSEDSDDDDVKFKVFSPAYRGKHKPHHRHSHNGDTNLA